MSGHLANWYLDREQFEPVRDQPGLYRLMHPEENGERRASQAVRDLRAQGYAVQADIVLDPDLGPVRPRPEARYEVRRVRIARAAAASSPQRAFTPEAGAASSRSTPGSAPAVRIVPVPERSRAR